MFMAVFFQSFSGYRFESMFLFHVRRKMLNHVNFNGRFILCTSMIRAYRCEIGSNSVTRKAIFFVCFFFVCADFSFAFLGLVSRTPIIYLYSVGVCCYQIQWYRFLINSIVERLFIHQTRLKYSINVSSPQEYHVIKWMRSIISGSLSQIYYGLFIWLIF